MDIAQLREEFGRTLHDAQAIIDAHPNGMGAEKQLEYKRLRDRLGELQTEISGTNDLLEQKKDLQGLTEWMEKPQYRIPHGIETSNPLERKKVLESAGWEVKADGMVYAPTSFNGGQSVALYPEETLFGDMPTDDVRAASYYRQSRSALNPLYRKSYSHWLQNAVRTRSESMAFNMLPPEEQKALSEGTDEGGGFLVPPDIQAEILVRLPKKSVMRNHATVRNTSRDEIKFPAIAPNPNNPNNTIPDGSIYTSGFVGGWAGETPAFSDTDPGIQQFPIRVKKIRVATKLSNDLIADSVANVLAFLSQDGATNMGLVEDKGFIAGLGSDLQPLGILNAPSVGTVNVAGSTAHTISNTSAAIGSVPGIINLAYALPEQYLGGATWLMQRPTEGHIRNLVDAQNRPIWLPYTAGGLGAAPREIEGYAVENSPFVDADGTNGNHPVIFGDLSQYIIVQRAQITTVILRERFADTDQTGIILFSRVGGALWNYDAVRLGVV